MRSIVFAFIVIVLASCQNESKNVAVIRGQGFMDKQTVKFEWFKKHSADFHPSAVEAKVDSLGAFEVEIPLTAITKGMMVVNESRYDLVLKPNENLTIQIASDSMLLFSGDGAERNRFLHSLSKKAYGSKMNVMMAWYTTDNEFSELYTILEDYLSTRYEALKQATPELLKDKQFVTYFNNGTALDSLDLIMQAPLAYSRKNNIPMDSVKVPEQYDFPIYLSQVQNDNKLTNEDYLHLLNNIIHEDVLTLMDSDSTLTRDETKLSIIMDSLSGSTREYFLVQNIYMKLSIYDECDSSYFIAFDSIKSNADCMAVVDFERARYDKKKAMLGAPLHADFLNTMVYDTANNELTLGAVFAESKHKVLYLDVWSLGCGPCRMAMPHSKKLKEELDGQPVEFIYLTVDNYSDKLWNEVYEVSLTKHNHYRFAKGFGAKMLKLFNTMAVPTYMIVDKEGKLVNYKAERPFDNSFSFNEKLVGQLKELAIK